MPSRIVESLNVAGFAGFFPDVWQSSGGRLAGVVANAGGVGVIASLGLGLNSPYFSTQPRCGNFFVANQLALIDELQKARAISSRELLVSIFWLQLKTIRYWYRQR